jgi:hypothetical protein
MGKVRKIKPARGKSSKNRLKVNKRIAENNEVLNNIKNKNKL